MPAYTCTCTHTRTHLHASPPHTPIRQSLPTCSTNNLTGGLVDWEGWKGREQIQSCYPSCPHFTSYKQDLLLPGFARWHKSLDATMHPIVHGIMFYIPTGLECGIFILSGSVLYSCLIFSVYHPYHTHVSLAVSTIHTILMSHQCLPSIPIPYSCLISAYHPYPYHTHVSSVPTIHTHTILMSHFQCLPSIPYSCLIMSVYHPYPYHTQVSSVSTTHNHTMSHYQYLPPIPYSCLIFSVYHPYHTHVSLWVCLPSIPIPYSGLISVYHP